MLCAPRLGILLDIAPMRPLLALLAFALLALTPARALETFPSSDPRAVLQTVIALTDRHALPGWSDRDFQAKLRPYLTDSLLAAVAKGGRIAAARGIDLYDGEFFTGSQDVAHAKLFSAAIARLAGDAATVEAVVGASDDPAAEPKTGDHMRYQMQRVGGVWKIDDFKNLESYAAAQPSVKTLFSDPARYGQ